MKVFKKLNYKTYFKKFELSKLMQKDFDKVLKIETKDSGIGLKIESWKRFLQNWREENPLSSDDANLRSMANNRLQYWEREQSKVSELEQVESDLEEQAKQAKQAKQAYVFLLTLQRYNNVMVFFVKLTDSEQNCLGTTII